MVFGTHQEIHILSKQPLETIAASIPFGAREVFVTQTLKIACGTIEVLGHGWRERRIIALHSDANLSKYGFR